MFKNVYGFMGREDKEHHSRLLALEMNSYLDKIYRTMKRKPGLKPARVRPGQFVMKHASLGATKMWEFRLNKREEAAKGDVGSIVVVTRGLEDEMLRKQRALFMAAEFYVYHSFANDPDPQHFRSISSQNQYWDVLKQFLGKQNSHELRDHAVRYVVEEIKEHKLAHFRHTGWFVSIAKLKQHHPKMAGMLGSSEHTFNEILRKQHQAFSPDMLKQEEDLVRKEIEDIRFLLKMLEERRHPKLSPEMKRLMDIHFENLGLFRDVLAKIAGNLEDWVVVDKAEHSELRKKLDLSSSELHRLLLAEAEAEEIDINKVHLIFRHFKKEKINILRDLELIDRMSAQRTHHA
jgi:hypothetical protein